MIVQSLLELIGGLISTLLDLLPDLPDSISTWFSSIESESAQVGAYAAIADGWFPITTLTGGILVLLGLKIVIDTWRAIVFLYNLIPFKMT